MSSQWYVVRSISGQEKKVKTYMESEIKRLRLGDYIAQILIPMEIVFEMRGGKKRTRERPLLPGYIFVEMQTGTSHDGRSAPVQPEIVAIIRDVPGVVGFLGDEKGKVPVPMRKDEIDKILGKVDELKDAGEIMENPFSVAETVKVIDGPFNGFSGIVEEVQEDKKKLKVMVKIFGRNTPLELNFMQVERA